MFDSFRVRLTLWYAGALGAALVVFSLGVYSLLSKSVHDRLNATIQSAMQVTALSLNHEIEEHDGKVPGEESVRLVLNTMHQTSFPRPSIAIFDHDRLVAVKPGSEGLPIEGAQEARASVQAESFFTLPWNGDSYRVGRISVDVPRIREQYVVLAAQSMTATEQELASFRRILWICVPIAIILAVSGGLFLVGKSLAPVISMSETVARISSGNLHERLSIANPKDELGKLGATINELLGRLDLAFDQQRRFMADASHELRTPISVALTAAQVNLEPGLRSAEDYREGLHIVAQQLNRLQRVVQDMFVLAKADAGALHCSMRPFYLDELIDETVRGSRLIATPKGVSITANGLPDSICSGDEELLRRVIVNLLDNAIRHTGPDGTVSVSLARDEGWYELKVSDTGTGIPEAEQPFIFDRFYCANKARSRLESTSGGGAGLGLSIAQQIVLLHKGSIRLASSSSAGSVFLVRLPAPANVETTSEIDSDADIAAPSEPVRG